MQTYTKYQFIRKTPEKPDTIEWVQPEKWQWEVQYENGEILKQFADDGYFHQFQEIDQTRLIVFKMVNPETGQHFALPFDARKMKLIHFYRNFVLQDGKIRMKLYVFGYERKHWNGNEKHLVVITPENEFILTDNVDKVVVAY